MAYIIAHRANGGKYRENTKEAAKEVLAFPYVDGIELDVHMTKDKKFVLSHNAFIICKNLQIKNIKNATYEEISHCKKIDRLENVLDELCSKKIIILDLKIMSKKKTFMRFFLRVLKKYKLTPYLVSFDYKFVKKIKKKRPKLKVGYIKGFFINQEKSKDNLDFCICHYKSYKNEEGIWTVNKYEEFKKYKNKDILIITDHPEFNK